MTEVSNTELSSIRGASVKAYQTESLKEERVTFFLIEVSIGPVPSVTYEIRRRYRDFDALYIQLARRHGANGVPELPPKQIFFKNESREFLEVNPHYALTLNRA